jgi:plastocyanin
LGQEETVKNTIPLVPFLAMLVMGLGSCATAPTVRAEASAGGPAVLIQASDFRFDPNEIAVHGTGTLTVTVANTSATAHNLTVDDPKGAVIDSVEIPAHATVSTQVNFSTPGSYYFFCNHPLHADLGMKGHFIVTGG